jgi:hypothetical protein
MSLESDGGTSYAYHDLASAIAYTSGYTFAATVLHFGNVSRETFIIGEIQASNTPLFWLESESHGASSTFRYWIGAGFDGGDSDWIALTQPIAQVQTATGYVLNICATFDPTTDTLVAYANGTLLTPSQQLSGTGNFLDDVTRVDYLADEADTNVPPAVLQRFAFWDRILDTDTQKALSELTCLSPLMIQDGLKIYWRNLYTRDR